ncbi:MAG: KUP/HAK/KT family potassium transporter [Acetobacteraceae bacterium]|nr:KUP/HAK/KT family potassium transporter [Acetobacteraceae bacterium]
MSQPWRMRGAMPAIGLAALGVVYGDIGTSPLYAFKVSLGAAGGSGQAIGIASLIIWSLLIVVSFKYAWLILRADNRGEGGVVAMLALLNARDAPQGSWRGALLVFGLIGAALLYGDGTITPAISVLSAVEGLKPEAPRLAPAVLPITVVILAALFLIQARGTGFVGRIFGPVMLCWFLSIGVLGAVGIAKHPAVLEALTPFPALKLLVSAPWRLNFAILGAVFLAVTGGEAMYADMGHFGRGAIRLAWFVVALPCLVLNYLGQAALVTASPAAASNSFFALAPAWAHLPVIAFATAATVIASQAIISGAFSLTQQCIQLGFLPRVRIRHTAMEAHGQIYVPLANWLLALATIAAVLFFGSSDALAGAYGIAVSGLMAISTFLAALVALRWGYNPVLVLLVNGALLLVDLLFFSSNALKFFQGGWFPLSIAGAVAFLMLTWRRGVQLVENARAAQRRPEEQFFAMLDQEAVCRVPGVAAFLSAATSGVPLSLSHFLRHARSLATRALLVSVISEEIPCVGKDRRAEVHRLRCEFDRVILRYGFMEWPDIPAGLRAAGLNDVNLDEVSYYIGRETVIADPAIPGMAPWRERLFGWMQRNSATRGASFCIPSAQLVEVGMEVRI